jgi:DNA-directed RNA polymerase subunit RPC12/RpoP
MESSPATPVEKMFEDLLRHGIAAARHGEVTLARSLLERAVQLKVADARPWLWLSRLTDDPTEQRKYLEFAVAAEPHNESARRQLVLLSDKLDRSRLVPQGEPVAMLRLTEPLEVDGQSVQCSQCGRRMSFNPQVASLTCNYCGNIQAVEANLAADSTEQVLDFVMPTTRAHRWAEARKLVICQSCGAVVMLDPGHLVSRCSYCGSNHLFDCPEMEELLEPQVIGLVALDAENAHLHVRS